MITTEQDYINGIQARCWDDAEVYCPNCESMDTTLHNLSVSVHQSSAANGIKGMKFGGYITCDDCNHTHHFHLDTNGQSRDERTGGTFTIKAEGTTKDFKKGNYPLQVCNWETVE
jgi:hypothetical protein